MNKKLPDSFGKERIYNKNFKDTKQPIILWDVLKIKSEQNIIVRFLKTNSNNLQGIRLAIDVGNGEIIINNIKSKIFELWADTCPYEVEIQCYSEEGFLSVYNIYEKKGEWGGRRSQTAYCGMILEKNNNVYRYYCNDVYSDNISFDKLVFELELCDNKSQSHTEDG